MILVTACYFPERMWVVRRPGVRVVRTPSGPAAAALLDRESPIRALVATGFCGGLDPSLRPGDIAIATEIAGRDERIPIEPRLVEYAVAATERVGRSYAVGPFACVERIVAGPGEKRALAERTGAIAVDMESGPLARWAGERRIPFVAVRGVLDRRDERLPFGAGVEVGALRVGLRALGAGRPAGRAVGALAGALAKEVDGCAGR